MAEIELKDETVVRSNLKFTAMLIAGLVSALFVFYGLRSDVLSLLKTVVEQQQAIQQQQAQIVEMRIAMTRIETSVDYIKSSITPNKTR